MVWNRTAEKTVPLVERGAEAAPSPGEAAARAAIVITFLADDNALEEVALGPEGIAARLGPGGVHLSSMSAISPALARRLAAAHREQDAGDVAAPVFGRPDAAAARQAWIVTSGAAAAKAKAHPILEALGQGVHDLGEDPAAAHIVKLAGNFLIAAATEAMAEAYTLGEKCGLDRGQLAEFFGASLFPSRIYQHWCPVWIGGRPRPACTKRSRSPDSRPHEFSSCVRPPRSLAFWADQGDGEKAYQLLAPIYGGFTEGFDTADLKDAETLLKNCGSASSSGLLAHPRGFANSASGGAPRGPSLHRQYRANRRHFQRLAMGFGGAFLDVIPKTSSPAETTRTRSVGEPLVPAWLPIHVLATNQGLSALN